ncbi:MAG TPA: BTAD domain-containing putative transcriptional regulator, partial [Gemmatimonadaceae bacterium]|nr:BTAD domain-containing putative transcriptional regulator [Gemmatimonadaceae bacterium]
MRLITLGRLALAVPPGADDEALNKRRRKLALLSVLALAKRPMPRDALLEMFWGDQTEARARHSLSDALSHLRRVLGREAITLHAADVALEEGAGLHVDAIEFAEAVADRDYERAAALYGGPFLHGVYIAGSPSFEQWMVRERSRLEGLFLQMCERQCMVLARARRWDECGALAARWLDAAPLSADAALFRLNALKAPGTRDADQRALDEYDRLAARLARDYDLAPEKSVAALARDISARLAASRPAPRVADAATEPPAAERAMAAGAASTEAATLAAPAPPATNGA